MTHIRNYFFIGLYISICVACKDTKTPVTMKMLLAKAAKGYFYIPQNEYAATIKAKHYDSLWQRATPHDKYKYRYQAAVAHLSAGTTPIAIRYLEELITVRNRSRFVVGLAPGEEDRLESLLGLAYLRLGEQENCILNHTAESCIIPIQSAGVHQKKQGSLKAIEIYTKLLKSNSRDLTSQWLLNIAYMTLGEYPSAVPPQWLIPSAQFEAAFPLLAFKEMGHYSGIAINQLSGGGIVDDFDNDGFLDIMASSWFPNHPIRYFINQQDGTFKETTNTKTLDGIGGGLNMVQGDYNNDGYVDVLVLRGAWMDSLGKQPNSLLRNNGDHTFTDVTLDTGILSMNPTQTAVWSDFNNDGYLDIFIGNESGVNKPRACELFLNQQGEKFVNVAMTANAAVSTEKEQFYVKGVDAADYNNDGKQDILISTMGHNSRTLLLQNIGNDAAGVPHFKEVGKTVGLAAPFSSFTTWFWDYNNDGHIDIFMAGYKRSSIRRPITHDIAAEYLGVPHRAETGRIFQNQGDGTFTDVSASVGMNKILYAMGANYGDLDNDGFLDVFLGTGEVDFASIIPNRVFRNDQGSTFQEVTTAGGFGNIQKGHAVSFADIDNDGDQDIHVVMGGAYEGDVYANSLFINPYNNTHNWITLQLQGVQANRSAIGSKLILTLACEGKERKLYRTIKSGGSFGANPLRAEIGLGNCTKIKEVMIEWAGSGTIQRLTDLKPNSFYTIKEEVE